jgi:predicted DCC family thiol-disulfide oxidoreductase YuxK
VGRHVILYDRDCGFCRTCTALVLAWDRRRALRPVALQEPEGERLLAGMPAAERMASWHLVSPGGRVHSAGAAFEPLLRLLPGGGPPAALAGRFPDAAARGYRAVADMRSPLGKALPARLRRRADALIAARERERG